MQKLANVSSQVNYISQGKILAEQGGVIRSICIDCLDRTNVTQSYLARSEVFKFSTAAIWVDQGDEISLEYSGTHAMKRDFVRYGKQTMAGIIKDGMSAISSPISRYYLNNFQDGVRQDAIDFISGRYTVNRNGRTPFQHKGFDSLSYLPVASALAIGGLTATSITLNRSGRSVQRILSSIIRAGVTAGLISIIKSNGKTNLVKATLV